MNDSKDFVEIRDIGCLTLLRMNKVKPAQRRTQNVNGKVRLIYLFQPHELGSLVDDYFNYRVQVDARDFARELKITKQEIYDRKINLPGGQNEKGPDVG